MGTQHIPFLKFLKTLSLLLPVGLFLNSCATDTAWPVMEHKVTSSREKTSPDAILVCWEKPVEEYRVLSELKADLSPEEASDTYALALVVESMKKKAARRGANGLLLRHRDKIALYQPNNTLNINSFIQEDKTTKQKYLESKAIWIEETRGTHGGDEAGGESLSGKEYRKIY